VPVALPERRERLDRVPLVADRGDDPLDVAADVLADLVRLPALRRPAEGVADGGARERRRRTIAQPGG
jgi:hypothetical protein